MTMKHITERRKMASAGLAAAMSGLLLLGGCASVLDSSRMVDEPLLPAAPERTLDEPSELALARAEAMLGAKQFEAAYGKFASVLRDQPDNFKARLGAAEASLGLGKLGEALAGFESAMEAVEYRPAALQGRGITLSLIGQRELGQTLLLQAVAEDPSLWRAWNAIGRNHDMADNPDFALEAYDRALRANSRAGAIHNNRGLALLALRRYAEAESAFRKALLIEPESGTAQMNLRLTVAWQGRYNEALVGLKPGHLPLALNNVGFVAMQKGDLDVAKSCFVKAMEASPSYYARAARNLEYLEEIRSTTVLSAEAQG